LLKVNCPNCGGENVFRSAGLPSRVCDYCQTILVRSGDTVEPVGKAASLPFDVSPIQIGTMGTFDGVGFTVIGRVRWGWTDGSWNEWLMLFDDGTDAWLGEAMGTYMLTRARPIEEIRARPVQQLAYGEKVPVGTEAVIDGETFIVSDSRAATCLAAEGELPFKAPPGWTIHSTDFRSASGACASLQKDGDHTDFYMGRYVTLDELKPHYLREILGWKVPAFG
jgi:hypothetical protein